MKTTPIRALLIDDHEMLLRGLRLISDTIDGIDIVAATTAGAEALMLAREHTVDIIITDAAMPGVDGLGVVKQCAPEFPVLVLTTFDDASLVSALLSAGAAGYILKDVAPEQFARAIADAAAGGLVLDPRIARFAHEAPTNELAILTRAERGVAELIAQGKTNQEIAAQLHLAEGTVKNHVSRILGKVGARDRTALALRLSGSLRGSD